MKLSLIIAVYNAEETLGEQLDALAAEDWSGQWEVILSDNGSTDRSMDIARSYEGQIANLRLIDSSDQRGAAHARDKAVQLAVGETVAFVDADDVIGKGWVRAMAEASETHDFMASRFDYQKLRVRPEQAYCGGTQLDGIQHMWWAPFYPHAGACGLAVKKSLYEAVGGFDPDWHALEDTDLCIRLHQHGVRLRFVPDALMCIRARSNYKGIFRQAKCWGQYNARLYKQYRLKDQKLPQPIRHFCRDAYKALKRYIRGPVNARVIYQLGWHFGLLKGSLLYRVAPPVTGLVPIPEGIDDECQAHTQVNSQSPAHANSAG